MNNKEFSKQLEDRIKMLAISIIKLSALLPGTPVCKVVWNHFTKSGTGLGAKYREVNCSRRKADFTCVTDRAKAYPESKVFLL